MRLDATGRVYEKKILCVLCSKSHSARQKNGRGGILHRIRQNSPKIRSFRKVDPVVPKTAHVTHPKHNAAFVECSAKIFF